MRRIASHAVYCGQLYRMHYVELTDSGLFAGIYPLTQELAGTEFYDGILVVLPQGPAGSLQPVAIGEGVEVRLVVLNGSPLTATELRTDNRRGNRHV